jgi:predicted enzyme related to lactoylglutathione lyase
MPGKIVHFELVAADADRATTFWSGLFPWDVGTSAMEGFDYRMFQTGDDQGGAIYPGENPGAGPIVYFDTDDIERSVARVRELGGEADEPSPIPGVGWFARCRDTEGNSFSLFKSDESVPMPGGQG